MMKALARACSARNASAFSIWVRIGKISASRVGRFGLAAKLAGYLPSAKFVISLSIISFLHGRDMDSDALLTFLTVHRRGGISNAAKALHRSQPAISRRIALLEQELGVPLFERIAGRTMLSDAGRVMVPYAERAVAAARDAENAVRALARPNSGPIALAVVGTLAGGRLSAILKRFAAEHPEVELSLRTATSAEVSDMIRRGEATIGLRYDRDRSRDLDCELLFAERLQVVCASDHPRAGHRLAKLAELRGERWIAFPVMPGRREITAAHVFALFQTHGLGEVDWTPVDSLTAQKRLVEAGLGIAAVGEQCRGGAATQDDRDHRRARSQGEPRCRHSDAPWGFLERGGAPVAGDCAERVSEDKGTRTLAPSFRVRARARPGMTLNVRSRPSPGRRPAPSARPS
jgi:DNA-binding transcriptional LysR family regulator